MFCVVSQLRVNISRANLHRPRFNASLYEVQISEDTKPSVTLLTLEAHDKDASSSRLTYELVTAFHVKEASYFFVEPATGEIILTNSLDR